MADVAIDRLVLEVPGLAAADGRRLAEMVALRLSASRWAPARSVDRVEIAVTAAPGEAGIEHLAGLIVDEMRRRMS